MNNHQQKEVVKALMVAYEVMGKQMTDAGAMMILNALKGFEFNAVMRAIHRTVSEAKFITPAEIISRVDDGRPDPEKAWAQVCNYDPDETYSECITEEQSFARGACWHLLIDGDNVAARMAFKEEYIKLCAENRAQGLPVKHVFHFGMNKENRLDVVKQALLQGKVTQKQALAHLPERKHEILSLPAPQSEDGAKIIQGMVKTLASGVGQ